MRLKTLEIKGFKSFADKTVLHFDEGVTGVIGPNGCGKSNIIDSIRWVIGEHKISNLRSENQSGLVFNGSKTRSASGMAEVSLTFENTRNVLPTEFTTVTITRKFYKNGDSEYRLNDVACRLKDIHNLFMDTGVSTDSYAIIELGMVDDIIKDKENSRRRMLEQAAGISIYKTRKKEAKSKLEATEGDLNRIEDLLFEINNNLKTLEAQARKAERFYEVKKEYREVSIELAKAALEGFNVTFKELTDEQQAESDKKLALETEITAAEASVEEDKLHFVAKERELQVLQKSFNELVSTIRTKENDKNLASQQLTYLKERERNISQFLSNAEGQLQGLTDSISFTSTQVEEEQEAFETLQDQLEGLQDMVEEKKEVFNQKKLSLENQRRDQQQWQRQQFEAEKKVAVADTSVQNLQRSIQQLQEEKAGRLQQITQLEEEKVILHETLQDQKADLEDMIAFQEETKGKILATQGEIEGLRDRLVDENRTLDQKKNEYDLLKSLVDSLEGYPESIKFLKKNTEWNNAAPILSDIFFCKEEYRTCVENLLEPYLNYYVVNNAAEAIQAIRLLDTNKKGKANFFILDQFHQQNGHPAAPPGSIPALEVVELEERYKGLGNYLLGKVFIADDISILEFDQLADQDVLVIEKSGRMNRGRYSFSGGSVGLFEGKKLGRAKNLEKLDEEIKALEEVVASLRHQIQEKHNQVLGYNTQLNENKINAAREKINQLNNQVFGLQNRIENFRQLVESGDKRLLEMQDSLEANQDSIKGVREELEELNEKVFALQDSIVAAEKAAADAEQQFNQANVQFNNQNLQHTRQQSKVQALRQELDFKRKQLSDLHTQITSNKSQLEDAVANIAAAEEKLGTAEDGLIDLFRKKEEEEKELNEKDQEYYNFRNQLQEKETTLRARQRAKEQLEQSLTVIKDKVNELKLQLASMKERLSVEFKVNLDEIIDEQRSSALPVDELQGSAERLKKRLENMGEINPTAIEAYQEMKKRYEFILEQKTDLVTAKESLMATIQEVEATANQKFLDTFNQVKENFVRVFKALFTEEDQCDMILNDPENLADTGIEIIAKPKGKRPAAITQLSGGEKTLTATALLFAIYLIKPAPFCILDEVDAPLDDANVGKFTNMIRKFSDNSQFIIVTHNKQTMAAVDVIYGVTMQEPGVSKLVPVDFRSLN
ncbi:chromosome segregation protein SMC [Chitinophaga pinensis]|uniref:Chromosome partition protein Smc n=1 Tax=Chitinophaga pinensis (strain ATCC 43595 / DSM 2588 / LMG 13176 / NBRC 15968 / NCIMB 11800 / UQM 2034) TaxID=485918 RepID=A0A979G7F6_CHIPD|nr:chromosome segregation protein SMC [Chitinophaga pinensis]ACU62156.1 chromosome segregation protein SMC [Chitinophaga pinensis DSM 2588]